MSAYAQGKRWQLALQVLADCQTWAEVDTISYNVVMTACEKGEQGQCAVALLKDM